MTKIEMLKKELKKARLARDKFRIGILGTLISEVEMIGKNDGNRETTDEEVMAKIAKFKSGAVEIITFVEIDSPMWTDAMKECDIYDEFLPTQLTEEDLTRELGIYLQTNAGKANIGAIMGFFGKNFKGQYDGKVLAKLTNEVLKGE